jgi:hypothetical protein
MGDASTLLGSAALEEDAKLGLGIERTVMPRSPFEIESKIDYIRLRHSGLAGSGRVVGLDFFGRPN